MFDVTKIAIRCETTKLIEWKDGVGVLAYYW